MEVGKETVFHRLKHTQQFAKLCLGSSLFFSERGKGRGEKLLGGCQRLKLQPHLASCDWSLITCRVKFRHWIKVKEGAAEGGRTRKSDKGWR